MIDVLYGQALHSYIIKIEVEAPDGTVETKQLNYVSHFDIATKGGANKLYEVMREVWVRISSQTKVGYFVSVNIVLQRRNAIVMN